MLGPYIVLNTLFSNTLSLRSSINVSDQVSHPYKTTGNNIVLYLYTVTSFCILISRHDHVLGFVSICFQSSLLTSSY
jgi:hypothetical protein